MTLQSQLQKLTARQSSSVWGRLRCRRASIVCDGVPSPRQCPLASANCVSIVTWNVGHHLRTDSCSMAGGSMRWPHLGHSVSSGNEWSRDADEVMVIVSKTIKTARLCSLRVILHFGMALVPEVNFPFILTEHQYEHWCVRKPGTKPINYEMTCDHKTFDLWSESEDSEENIILYRPLQMPFQWLPT